MAVKKKRTRTPVDSVVHKDKRSNIPTEELRDFVADDEREPEKLRYPRDPSLDPQLVWKGKDEQDGEDLKVPAVPIYIQEKIHPKALIENLRDTAAAGDEEPELRLFDDFNGIDFEQLIDFYQHQQNWANRMILGDSLMVMTSLAEKEGLKGKVQMIYVDPPYGIKFGSNWQVSTRKREVKDGKAEDLVRQPEQVKAFRDTWEQGIHSYLTYLRDRLVVARDLLTESGSVFIQMGDENVHLIRNLLDEVFGSENFAGQIAFFKTSSRSASGIPSVVDYLLVYARELEALKLRPILQLKRPGDRGAKQYTKIISPDMQTIRNMTEGELSGQIRIPENWEVCRLGPATSEGYQEGRSNPYNLNGERVPIKLNLHWKYDPSPGGAMDRLVALGRMRRSGKSLASVLLARDNPTTPLDNVWLDTGTGSFTEDQLFVVQTANKVIQRCILISTDPGDLVLDPTCGSGTTAYVAEQWGRRWITIDTSRVALALARVRLMAGRYPYYLLADSKEGAARQADLDGLEQPRGPFEEDIRKGFVYETVPHVTLSSIANNPDIKEGMSREELNAAIFRYDEKETLYDQPYEAPRRLRVTGPLTVESLSPHRTVSDDGQQPTSEIMTAPEAEGGGFENMIVENLKKAGVQNTIREERLTFERLEPYAGTWIQAEGEYRDREAEARRVAVSIGPEHGTVGPQHVREAAKEAVRGVGFDVLVVCGFAFDPHVSEEAKRYGQLTVLSARMNPDLAMGDELLKKTGTGNLFMVFGEPDVDIQQTERKFTVEIKGLDVYDPTTGQIRSSSTDDIACWFIDTNYNNESFFVRHAYFTGADKPYERIKRALRADIDEAAWESLYATKSRPFDVPATGKIAIKVINHYGDEILKVYEV